jgi:hypothetical protein
MRKSFSGQVAMCYLTFIMLLITSLKAQYNKNWMLGPMVTFEQTGPVVSPILNNVSFG